MDYLIREISYINGQAKTAGIKARKDIEEIAEDIGFKIMEIPSLKSTRKSKTVLGKIKEHLEVIFEWNKVLNNLRKNDRLLIQFPVIEHSIFFEIFLYRCQKKGIITILLIHDLEMMRYANKDNISMKRKIRINIEELRSVKRASYVIGHNDRMIEYLLNKKVNPKKLVNLKIFDYYIKSYDEQRVEERKISLDGPVIIAGNLNPNKTGYVYDLPLDCKFNLYGIGYKNTKQDNIKYNGSFDPEELIYAMNGSFGLVWDGVSSKTCTGLYGSYLRVNNPHKTSLYLAAGIPVVIWEEAALASFIKENNCGITIKSIDDLGNKISEMSEEEYLTILENVNKIGERLRKGYYTNKAISLCK